MKATLAGIGETGRLSRAMGEFGHLADYVRAKYDGLFNHLPTPEEWKAINKEYFSLKKSLEYAEASGASYVNFSEMERQFYEVSTLREAHIRNIRKAAKDWQEYQ